ncbi:MAG: glycosyltransferase, partial [Geminicoccaceae bacterium]|nr:glycosyltransferase [Geminicoccaceae bacterium]
IEVLRLPYGIDPVLVIVDNDPESTARDAAEAAAAALDWPLRYRIEPRPGVSFVRNTALRLSWDCDFVAFIDDDETADSDWLAELLSSQRETKAAAVTGPTLPVFSAAGPAWLRPAFELCQVRPKGARAMREFATCNLLLDRRVLEREGLCFDEGLSLIGGEDTLLAAELVRRGHRIAWAERALTYEMIPASRMQLGWLMRRWFRTGNTDAMLAMRHRGALTGRVVGIGRGLIRIGAGLIALALSLPLCLIGVRERALLRLYTVARGAGMVAATLGRQHREYTVVHGG